MPCSDITDRIELVLDPNDRVLGYTLRKLTCGAEVGHATLLADMVCGQPMTDIMALHGDDIVARFSPDKNEEFLYFKHLVAVQEALAVISGHTAGAPGGACVTESVVTSEEGLSFAGQLAIDLMTERIRACGGCGSCGSARKQAV